MVGSETSDGGSRWIMQPIWHHELPRKCNISSFIIQLMEAVLGYGSCFLSCEVPTSLPARISKRDNSGPKCSAGETVSQSDFRLRGLRFDPLL